MRLLLLLLSLLIAGPSLARADDEPIGPIEDDDEKRIWFYVDDGGLVTFVDSLDLVPPRYQDRARPTNLSTADQPPLSRETARPQSPAPGPAREEATPEPEPEPEQPSAAERLAQLRGERDEIVDEIGALSEGWSDQGELSDEALEQRSVQLEQRLEKVDREIGELDKVLRR